MKRIAATILLTLLALAPREAAAAGCYSTNYQKAEELFRQGSFSAAIKRYRAAKACPDKPKSDNIDVRISECNRRLNPPKPTYYLTVDGVSDGPYVSFPARGGSRTFSVSTNAPSWECWKTGEAPWLSMSRSSTGFTITCKTTPLDSPRSCDMMIRAGDIYKQIKISQDGDPNARPSAEIDAIWVNHNQYQDGKKGMLIYMNFTTYNMLNRNGKCIAHFYNSNGKTLKDTNGFYHRGGDVAASKTFRPDFASSSYTNFNIFMPYSELHITTTSGGRISLKFQIIIWEGDGGVWPCAISDWQYFTYTP